MNKPYVRHRWELTLALTLFFVLCYAAFCSAQQETLSQDVLRLRVVANSDTQTDQAVKLRVRDQVLTVVQPMQEQAANPDDMRALLQAHMQEITNAAQKEVYACGGTQLVTAQLARDWYPTKAYDTFSLPAGWYDGLQLRIGAARGHNWWCVVYPSLCLNAAEGETTLTEDERNFIHQSGTSCEIRFRTAELLGNLRGMMS